MLKSKCSNCRPVSSWDFTFEPMALTPVTMSWLGCGMITLTSPFCSAGTSCVESEMAVKVILSKYGPEGPYHLGLGTSTTLVPSDAADWTRYGPSDQVGAVLSNQVHEASRPLSPLFSALSAASVSLVL